MHPFQERPFKMGDRRDDVGYKTTVSVLASVVAILLGLFVNAAWNTAYDGNKKADALAITVQRLEARYESIQDDLTEIKGLLKRTTPFERGDAHAL